MHCLPLVLLTLLGGEQVLDDFRYADIAAARQAWIAGESTAPVEVAADVDRSVLKVEAPFASQQKLARAVIDRKCQLDLNAPSGFDLELSVSAPQSVGYVGLYFHSGDGWYVAGRPVGREGGRTIHFPKSAFQAEGTPDSWRQISGLRIAVWRSNGTASDTSVYFRRLTARWRDVAVIVPDQPSEKSEGEQLAARDAAATVIDLLDDLGLGADAISESAAVDGALAWRRIAIVPYNPGLRDDTIETLARFAEGRGKLIVCYMLPQRLGAALGFRNPRYIRQNRPGQFAEMRFDAGTLDALPGLVRQQSWNIMTAEPAAENARVIGRWYDDAGKATDCNAVLLSDRGAYFSHILLRDDLETKKQLLAAILGKLAPALWEDMAKFALEDSGRVGHCENVDELTAYLQPHQAAEAVAEKLASAERAWQRAQTQFANKAYSEAVASARRARDSFIAAYLRVPEGAACEGRAVWNHSGTGAFPGDWDRSAKLLSENGFNMVLPNMLWGGVAHYASDVLPRSATFEKYGDQIEQCCAAAKKYGIEVHAWKVNFNLLGAPKEFVETMRREGRTQVSVSGKPQDWLCPSHAENQKLELESMLEVARKYPIDGLHFDYIRYPGRETCYCDGCRQRFESQSGRKVSDWPVECHSGDRKEEYNAWRCRQITALVEAVSREARQMRPGLKISAAVFGSYPGCRESVAQDWPAWVKAGYLDFLCPMDYTERDAEFVSLVQNQLKLVEGRIPVYPGIGATASRMALSADRVAGQIHHARSLGAGGFTIFNFDQQTAESIIPSVGLGAGSQPNALPHGVSLLLPNADFEQGDAMPAGWTLSGGQGRWADRQTLEVTGTGREGNQWSCDCRFAPGQLYRFQMRARGERGGTAVCGPSFANHDQPLSAKWAWYGYVFRTPEAMENARVRVGQWEVAGSLQFDAVRLVPVTPAYHPVGPFELGEGESIAAGRYTFSGAFWHEGSNFHRTLLRTTTGFNSNRWCFSGKSEVVYRFGVPGFPFRTGAVQFDINYHVRGGCVAEISRDQIAWQALAKRESCGQATGEVPAGMLPAETLYLRLRGANEDSEFQVDQVGFSGALAGTPAEGRGQTAFADVSDGRLGLTVAGLTLDDSLGRDRPVVRVAVKNTTDSAMQATLFAKGTVQSGDPASERGLSMADQVGPARGVPAQGIAVFEAAASLDRIGTFDVSLSLRTDAGEAIGLTVPWTLPEYYRADYGQRIEGVAGDANVWWCEATWKVAPQRGVPQAAAPAATLSAARNDREAVQVVLRPKRELRRLTAAVGPLIGPDGAVIPADHVQVLRVYYHFVHEPTDKVGVRDWWPDALPPFANPIDLPAGKNQPLWILVHVPKDAKAGDYSGTLSLKADGWAAEVPLRLHVWNFALPERNHLETAFGVNVDSVNAYQQLKTEADQRRVWDMYMQNLAEHRISPYRPAPFDPIGVRWMPEANPPRAELDFSAFDAAMGRAIEKYHITNFMLPIQGMGGGNFQGRAEPAIGDLGERTPQYQAMFTSQLQQLESHLREKGWSKMAYTYWFDEPEPKDYAFVQAGMDRIKKAAPGIQTMITKHELHADWHGGIDIWCPVSTAFQSEVAERRRAQGERYWWYVCCWPKEPYCTLFIDHPATDLRVWLWQTWQRKIVGILVWESAYWCARGDIRQNPYDDPMGYVAGSRPEERKYWGNGDGRFLYPPLAAATPGASGPEAVVEPPVSSIRWEMLREGIEDYEYFWLLRDLIERKRSLLAKDQVEAYVSLLDVPQEITSDLTAFSTDPKPIYQRRAAVAEAIEQLGKE